ncbi:hypothetical protein Syun_022757 [Stephania yunnanensis]|uniref:holo-[acyl-carrier-protein] synthase n=1 Tax=Stephania yunnanensis TaxID=152371 RepID=A0AAP0F7L9_9MAGN
MIKFVPRCYMLSFLCKRSCPMPIPRLTSKLFSSLSSNSVPIALPSHRETHFWYMLPDEVKDQALLNRYLEILSPCERENILSMKGNDLQKGALLARALVRTTLSRYTNSHVAPKSLMFRKNQYGKPEVEWQPDENWNPPSLHFNISHSSSLIACGVTLDVPIGIDVEEKQRTLKSNLLSFTRRYFSSDEVEYICAISDPEIQKQELNKLWTLKEAYVKALGRGIAAAPFKGFNIKFIATSNSKEQGSGAFVSEAFHVVVEAIDASIHHTNNWRFALFEVVGSHYAAICVKDSKMEDEATPIKLKVWKTIPFVEDVRVSVPQFLCI